MAYLVATIADGFMTDIPSRSAETFDPSIIFVLRIFLNLKGMSRIVAMFTAPEAAQAKIKVRTILASNKMSRRQF